PQWFAQQQLMADPLPFVFVIHACRPSLAGTLRRSRLAEQLLAGFVKAHHGIAGVVRPQVRLDHILHPPDKLGIGLGRHAPSLDDPGLDVVFLSACRTVSVPMASASPSTTSSSASSCTVQWQRPWGGSLQASWISCCFTVPLILTLSGRGGCGLGLTAASNPSVTKRCRTRAMVRGPMPMAATRSSSERCRPQVASANRRM